jgi:hypothetical protein
VSGALSVLTSCTLNGFTATIVTDIDYSSSLGAIVFHLYNIVNFAQGISNPFSIKSRFDGVLVAESGITSSTNAQASIATTKANPISVTKLDFYPQNEGERATYEIHFKTSSDIKEEETILWTFPEEYDYLLGTDL